MHFVYGKMQAKTLVIEVDQQTDQLATDLKGLSAQERYLLGKDVRASLQRIQDGRPKARRARTVSLNGQGVALFDHLTPFKVHEAKLFEQGTEAVLRMIAQLRKDDGDDDE